MQASGVLRMKVLKVVAGVAAALGALLLLTGAKRYDAGEFPPPIGYPDGNPKDPKYWLKMSVADAKYLVRKIIAYVKANRSLYAYITRKPTDAEFEAAYRASSKKWGVPYKVLRVIHLHESSEDPNPFALSNDKNSTALGLGQMTKQSAAAIGALWPLCIWWEYAIDTTAQLLVAKGWKNKPNMPSYGEIGDASVAADEGHGPSWFEAMVSYRGGDRTETIYSTYEKLISTIGNDDWPTPGSWGGLA